MVLFIITLWRLSLFIIAYITQVSFQFTPSFPYSDIYLIPSMLPQFIWGWANFDGVHYLTIASHGYFAQFTQAFFPLYPIVLSIAGKVIPFGQLYNRLIFGGLLVSFITFILTVHIFQKLLQLDYDHKKVKWILAFLICFPTSFYFGALYSESLFLLFTLAAFWFTRKRRWWLSGIFASIAAATRITGILLLPALLWEYIHEMKIKNQDNEIKKYPSNLFQTWAYYSSIILRSPLIYVVPLGLISYMLYLQINFNDMLYFWHAQSVFGAQRAGSSIIFPPQVIWRYLKIIFTVEKFSWGFWIGLLELLSFIVGACLLLNGHKIKIRLSYLIFGWLALLLPVLTGTLSSMPRYLVIIFPLYISLGLINKTGLKFLLLFLFSILLIVFTSIFIRGLWVA